MGTQRCESPCRPGSSQRPQSWQRRLGLGNAGRAARGDGGGAAAWYQKLTPWTHTMRTAVPADATQVLVSIVSHSFALVLLCHEAAAWLARTSGVRLASSRTGSSRAR